MKRFIAVFAISLLFAGLSTAANQVDIRMGGQASMGDTIYTAGLTAEFQVWIENDYILGGMSLGFQVWSPDGATWAWKNVGGHGLLTGCVKPVLTSRMGDGGVFDMTGLLVTEQNIDELGRDTIMCGGVALMQGLPPGPLQHMYSYYFTAGGDGGDNAWVGTLCFDSCFVPPSGAFVFVDPFGAAFNPTALWPNGGACWPVRNIPQMCPMWNPGIPSVMTVNACDTGLVTLSAVDPEGDAVSFALRALNGGGGTAQVIDNGDGTCDVIYIPVFADLGQSISIEVDVKDPWHQMGDCMPWTVTVQVTNIAPTITCGSTFNPVCQGNTLVKSDIVGTENDPCNILTYSVVGVMPTPIGAFHINDSTGVFTFNTENADAGILYNFCVEVTDGYETAECCFEVEVMGCEQFQVSIQKLHDVLQGHFVDVDVCLNRGAELMGGFDFLIGFDASALAFTEAALGEHFVNCGWEYFSYRFNWNGNCGNACPTGLIRLVGLAETNNGPNHPDWECLVSYNPGEDCTDCGAAIATLTFFVSNDRTLECQYVPIQFYWVDCNDNSMSSFSGDTLFVSDHVYDFEGTEITDPTYGFPTYFGIPDDPCMEGDKDVPVRFIDFCNGGVDIVCADSIDARGDINVNGVANEIADAVMFTNYFISGLSAFGNHVEASIAASDVNADGIALSVADLVYLVRVIVGDANPYPKPVPEIPVAVNAQGGFVTYDSPIDLGAALLTFQVNGEIGAPQLGSGAANMDMKYARKGNELRVLIYNIGSEMITAGENILVTVPGEVELTGAEVATFDGFGVDALIRNLPSSFTITNYPNPFNPATKISLSLPEASKWSIRVYNIMGQLVTDYSGYSDAGMVEVMWDGTDHNSNRVASGIYFYKAEAGKYSVTRKMMLTK